ncbi:fimbrial chaperone protein [Variovorax sp. TBS-050B]|uniref:fimbrial biogenesis chaperone n=1 Tax=Variovorax sp. TBS-050B TaxID=2940551 RepID=UPI0024754DB1|nr:molecular chaperone [Variovorax sp. TBS-050B]MDH6593939.1 fimbrial chaperone protein [Variovorax sp. TBS-050B]
MQRLLALSAAVLGLAIAGTGHAASLQVAPVSIDLNAPAQAAAIHLRNRGTEPVNVQVRVFKWSQDGGEEQLTPTTQVVASPPAASLQPGTTYTIRIARTAAPVTRGEESYRLLIDELPATNLVRPDTGVNMVIRYSIPVFFAERTAGAMLRWEVRRQGDELVAKAINTGDRHAKIVDLAVEEPGGRISFGDGLNGYVLPGSTKEWVVKARPIAPGSRVTITAKGNDHAVNETTIVEGR